MLGTSRLCVADEHFTHERKVVLGLSTYMPNVPAQSPPDFFCRLPCDSATPWHPMRRKLMKAPTVKSFVRQHVPDIPQSTNTDDGSSSQQRLVDTQLEGLPAFPACNTGYFQG